MRLFILFAFVLALAAAGPAGAEDAAPAPATVQDCLACHADPDLSVTFGSVESQSLRVEATAYGHSVHGSAFLRTDGGRARVG